MKVSELIEKFKECDGNSNVSIYIIDRGRYWELGIKAGDKVIAEICIDDNCAIIC